MLALPPVAAAALAAAGALVAAGVLAAAETHPPVSRTPHAAMARTDMTRFQCMTNLSFIRTNSPGLVTARWANPAPGLGVPAQEEHGAYGEDDHRVDAEHRELAPDGEQVRADLAWCGAGDLRDDVTTGQPPHHIRVPGTWQRLGKLRQQEQEPVRRGDRPRGAPQDRAEPKREQAAHRDVQRAGE